MLYYKQLSIIIHIGNVELITASADGKLGRVSTTLSSLDNTDLCLSLDWSERCSSGSDRQLVTSSSKGYLSVLQLSETELKLITKWKAHEFEAWIVAYDYWQSGRIIYSGADDALLKGWDVRMSPANTIFQSKRLALFFCFIYLYIPLWYILCIHICI